jgi:hypothetical protein
MLAEQVSRLPGSWQAASPSAIHLTRIAVQNIADQYPDSMAWPLQQSSADARASGDN